MSRPTRDPRADTAVRQWRVGLMADVLIAPMAEADTADMRRHIAADLLPTGRFVGSVICSTAPLPIPNGGSGLTLFALACVASR